MPSPEYLKQFVRDKLAAAAEEIFVVFHNTIVEYEKELDRHRKLLDVAWRPVVKLRRTDLPQHIALKEELIPTDQSSLDQDRNSSLDQKQLDLPQVEEQQEVISSELRLKQELVDLLLCSADEKSNVSENPTVDWNPKEPLHESEVSIPVITTVVSEADIDLSLYPGVSQSQQLEDDQFENSKSTTPKQKEQNSSFHKSQTDQDRIVPVLKSNISFTNDRRCKKFKRQSKLSKHRKSHFSRNQQVGETLQSSTQTVRQRKTINSDKKPFVCPACGKSFKFRSRLKTHQVIHTDLKPYVCQTCGKGFSYKTSLYNHQIIHTGERPFVCQTCGHAFIQKSHLKTHEKIHTGEKAFVCQTWQKFQTHVPNHTQKNSHWF